MNKPSENNNFVRNANCEPIGKNTGKPLEKVVTKSSSSSKISAIDNSNKNILHLIQQYFKDRNDSIIPTINERSFFSDTYISTILSAIKKDLLDKKITELIHIDGAGLDETNSTITKLIKEYRNKTCQQLLNEMITISFNDMNTKSILSQIDSSKIIKNFEIPWNRYQNNNIRGTIFIQIFNDQREEKPVCEHKFKDILFNETSSNYHPIEAKLSFNIKEVSNLNEKLYNLTINYKDFDNNDKVVTVNVNLSELSYIKFCCYIDITTPSFLNINTLNVIDFRNCHTMLDLSDVNDIYSSSSGGLWEITDGRTWSQRRKKTVKSNSLVFKWKKYYEVIGDYWDH